MSWTKAFKNMQPIGTVTHNSVTHNVYILWISKSFCFVERQTDFLGKFAARDWLVEKGASFTPAAGFSLNDWPKGNDTFSSNGLGMNWFSNPSLQNIAGYYEFSFGSFNEYGIFGNKPSPVGIVPSNATGFSLLKNGTFASNFYIDFQPSKNPIWQFVDAVEDGDLNVSGNRNNIKYEGTIDRPTFPGSLERSVVRTFYGLEIPLRTENGVDILEGWQVNLRDIIDDELEVKQPDDSEKVTLAKGTALDFTFKSKVFDGATEKTNYATTFSTIWAIKAGINAESYSQWRRGVFSEYFGKDRRFLTWYPRTETKIERVVRYEDKLYASFLLNMSPLPATINVVIVLRYPDAEHAIYYEYDKNMAVADILHINLSPCEWFIEEVVGDYQWAFMHYFEVFLINEKAERISEICRFVKDRAEPVASRWVQVRWSNSAGGWDSWRFLRESEDVAVSATTAERVLTAEYSTTDSELFVTDKKGREVVNLSTGAVDAKIIDWLEELVWSENVQVYDTEAEAWVACVVQNSAYKPAGLKEYLGRRTFALQRAKELVSYSKLPKGTVVEDRPKSWLPQDGYCITDAFGKYTGLQAYANLKLFYTDVNPNEAVRGVQKKANVPGTEGYIGPVSSSDCEVADTPFTNQLQSRTSSRVRSNCDNGFRGGPWTISVAAGTYGGTTQAEANARAVAAMDLMDTQANADANGTCIALTAGLQAEFWNFTPVNNMPPANVTGVAAQETKVVPSILFTNNLGLTTVLEDNFWARFTGFIKAFKTGNIDFYMKYDHAVSLKISGVELINQQAPNGYNWVKATVNMVKGQYYPLEVNFWELTGFYGVQLHWKIDSGDIVALGDTNLLY